VRGASAWGSAGRIFFVAARYFWIAALVASSAAFATACGAEGDAIRDAEIPLPPSPPYADADPPDAAGPSSGATPSDSPLAPADPAAAMAAGAGADAAVEVLLADAARHDELLVPFADEARFDWHYVPRQRPGLALGDMTELEREATAALLRALLGDAGYEAARGVVELEGIIRRDPGRYHLVLFGRPVGDGRWGWRFEGHHLSVNATELPDGRSSATPLFFGAEPARVAAGPRAGWRLLGAEEDLAKELVRSLSPEQRERAVVAARAPRDILTGTGREIRAPDGPPGIPVSALRPEQRALVERLVASYLGRLAPEIAEPWRRRIEPALGEHTFAWAGGTEPGEGHYYRISGPELLIEYDNVQDGANHAHTVLRDPRRDFGGDPLAEHYASSGHHRDG